MTKPFLFAPFSFLAISFFLLLNPTAALPGHDSTAGSMVKKSQRTILVETQYGQVSEVNISTGENGPYHLEFITLDPNSLFLPVLLHADMVFYVHTGSGTLSWADDDETKTVNLRRGDIYRLQPGSVFYVQSNVDPEMEKLRIHAFFSNADDASFEASIGAYSSLVDLVFGFHTKTLQSAFKVPEEVIEAMRNTTRPPVIVHVASKKRMTFRELEARFLKTILGGNRGDFFDFDNKKKKKKTKVYNIFEAGPDFKNCYGWSATVDSQDLRFLKGSNVGVFMVNLTKGSMMGPHWNPSATEIAVVLQGEGMVRMVCSSRGKQSKCKNMSFRVKEGDVFAVSRFHPMAQMSFNNDSLIFMGFSTTTKKNYPQFIAGKRSVLQVMDKRILALCFNVTNTTLDQIVSQQQDSLILDCTSCAEEEASIMEEEIRREEKKEEEKARREEEERQQREKEQEQKQEEEEARKREKEEEEARKREEEEARKREEEEEEEARRQEEERRQREKEQEQKREEEESRKREEEEEAKKREEEEQEEARQREEEEEARRQQERKREEEEREKKIGEEEGKQWEEEEASQRAEKRRREEAKAWEQEEVRKQEKERKTMGREEEEKEEWGEPETTLKRGAFWI
ncbi:hypothetical protein SLEP1_g8044 [Rubroshorea leprosula]|uniref:Cupin type-1 domain-containing protein n=1 Tax=Rubroshorea leprosula TaxID=152421 RepID=A0AAV5I9F8_9ROSI|nr:hypothetical protein SLEP1_g8044 [Rubroshorea leprosula]